LHGRAFYPQHAKGIALNPPMPRPETAHWGLAIGSLYRYVAPPAKGYSAIAEYSQARLPLVPDE